MRQAVCDDLGALGGGERTLGGGMNRPTLKGDGERVTAVGVPGQARPEEGEALIDDASTGPNLTHEASGEDLGVAGVGKVEETFQAGEELDVVRLWLVIVWVDSAARKRDWAEKGIDVSLPCRCEEGGHRVRSPAVDLREYLHGKGTRVRKHWRNEQRATSTRGQRALTP